MTQRKALSDANIMSRIAHIESSMKRICDFIPVTIWGFSSDVLAHLRRRKHHIVDDQLTKKERKTLTKSQKQQMARLIGGVCQRISDVFDILETRAKDVKPKKLKLLESPTRFCPESGSERYKFEERSMESEKSKTFESVIGCNNELNGENEHEREQSKTNQILQKRTVFAKTCRVGHEKRSIRSKRSGDQEVQQVNEASKSPEVSFSKFDFLIRADPKRRRSSSSNRGHSFTGKNYRSLLRNVRKRETALDRLRKKDPKRAVEIESEINWSRALKKSEGVKIKDNVELLLKGLKRMQKLKLKRKQRLCVKHRSMAKKKNPITAAYVRLTVKIELPDNGSFTERDFELFVRQSVTKVLGTCGPEVQIGGYDEVTHKGSIIISGEDAQLVWAALTISGQYQGRTIAAHFFSLTEFEASEDFILTPVF